MFSSTYSLHIFSYADRANAYWTGYFTSRPAFKGYVRMMGAYLLVRVFFLPLSISVKNLVSDVFPVVLDMH